MTTYQSTSLHVEDSRERSLAFTVADNPAEDDYALKAWSTQILSDGQVVNVEVEFTPDDVRDLQSYLRDRFGTGRVHQLQETSADAVKIALNNLLIQGYRIIAPNGADMGPDNVPFLLPVEPSDLEYATRLDGTTMPPPRVVQGEYCWCGGAVGAREPGDHLGLGCLLDITHNWTAASAESQTLIEAQCSLEGCSVTTPHYHGGDDELVRTAPVPRQCPVIYNGVQCLAPEGHAQPHDFGPIVATMPQTADRAAPLPADQGVPASSAAVSATTSAAPSAPVSTEPSEAEKGRRRRLKVEMEFDDALAAHKAEPTDETWARLAEAYKAVAKREPDNSRVRRALADLTGTDAELTAKEAEVLRIPGTGPAAAEAGPQFAPEPPAGTHVVGHHPGGGFFTSVDGKVVRGDTPEQVGENYLAQSMRPANQQFADAVSALPGQHVGDEIIMTPEEAAASQAFPCPQRAADGRQCLRPFGHELQTATNPEPKPHIYPTSQQLLEAQGQQHGVQPVQQHPVTGFIAPASAAPGAANAPLSFLVPPTPEQTQPHPDLVQQPAAPAAPTWQAPQQ